MQQRLSGHFDTRICPFSVIGKGNPGLAKKSANTSNVYLMETWDDALFMKVRQQVFGILSDRGTESGIADDTVAVIPRYADFVWSDPNDAFMYPKGMYILGHLHILYNALREAVKSLPDAQGYLNKLRMVESF